MVDSSCTIPFNFRLKAAGTGITILPSRIAMLLSLSAHPSSCAFATRLAYAGGDSGLLFSNAMTNVA